MFRQRKTKIPVLAATILVVHLSQCSAQETIRGLPCIKRLHQLYCRSQGNSYPDTEIETFIQLNLALTRRMFGEFSPPEDLYDEFPSFPDIQEFNTVDFPENLRPTDGVESNLASTSDFDEENVTRKNQRTQGDGRKTNGTQTLRSVKTPPRVSSASRFTNKTPRTPTRRNRKRGTSSGNSTSVKQMTRIQPSRVQNTRLPYTRLTTHVPTRSLYPNNVFLNSPDNVASASQPHQRTQTARERTTNQRSTHRRFKRAAKRRPSARRLPKISKTSKHLVDSCESQLEVTTPRWAANSAGKIRAIVNTEHFPQAIHQEICKGTTTRHCRGECTCEQKYAYHRLLAYDPNNECTGIFIDWFLFPSCCVCRCPP